MAYTAQRRFYRLNIAGASCFLMGVLLSQSVDRGVANFQLYLALILVFVGIIFSIKAFDTILYSEDTVEYTYEEDVKDTVEYIYEDDVKDNVEYAYEEDVQVESLP